MPRQRPIPLDDVLLNAIEACTICKVSRSRWDDYAKRYTALIRGCRIVQVNPTGKGVARWLKSAVVEHIHRELPREREPQS